jgi:CBS domain-containing protein
VGYRSAVAATGNPLLQSTIEALSAHAPFDAMEAAELQRLAGRLSLGYIARGQAIVGPDSGLADRLYIIKQGKVRGGAAAAAQAADVVLGPGECFPVGALAGRRAAVYTYRAEQDTFCWELPAADFHALLESSARFRAFCLDHLSLLLEQSHRARRAAAAAALGEGANMLAPLRSAIAREPVSCAPATPVAEVVGAMHAQRIGSMVVVDAQRMPVGIFTTPDVLARVTLPQVPMDTPIEKLMTPRPVTLEEEAPLVEAALAMARHGIRHVVVTRDGRLAGVISERDLFALQRASLGRATERVRAAQSVAQLAAAAGDSRQLVRQLLAQGVDAEHVTQMTSALNDGLSQRLIQLVAPRHALSGQHGALRVRWCWIALGSEGRMEQTLATDQDNALIFQAEGDAEAARRALLGFANEVNLGLEACGFPLCEGDIMARNPRWCLTLEEWQRVFDGWIRNTSPEALLNAAIFFDFRPIAGEAALAGVLREAVLAKTRGNPAFGRAMTESASQSRPPLGLLDGFLADGGERFPGTLDLKGGGARLFVDAARVLSLAHALPPTGTAARLRAAGAAGALPPEEVSASVDAFHYIQGLRLRRQHLEVEPPKGAENRIDPGKLNAVDARILKAAFRQAALLQERLRMDFGL